SAGAGLAAALALLARDRGGIRPVFQLLVYPMLDDRTVLREVDERSLRLWNQRSNRFGWRSYVGPAAGSDGVPALAARARHPDLAGLPPAWIGVGTNDLFHDEDVAYAKRLADAGVECALEVVPGAYHGFEGREPRAQVSRDFVNSQLVALRRGLAARTLR
ncbi:alpha/beta hydrolase fold domain-containing protein, partial [Arthrobacter sp.]|uniref:alpha/beta hydrolase fold domain-containing protein n=1 Tax=Arthrobacter sp. TaxID=1667 RepID=UPI00289BC64E